MRTARNRPGRSIYWEPEICPPWHLSPSLQVSSHSYVSDVHIFTFGPTCLTWVTFRNHFLLPMPLFQEVIDICRGEYFATVFCSHSFQLCHSLGNSRIVQTSFRFLAGCSCCGQNESVVNRSSVDPSFAACSPRALFACAPSACARCCTRQHAPVTPRVHPCPHRSLSSRARFSTWPQPPVAPSALHLPSRHPWWARLISEPWALIGTSGGAPPKAGSIFQVRSWPAWRCPRLTRHATARGGPGSSQASG